MHNKRRLENFDRTGIVYVSDEQQVPDPPHRIVEFQALNPETASLYDDSITLLFVEPTEEQSRIIQKCVDSTNYKGFDLSKFDPTIDLAMFDHFNFATTPKLPEYIKTLRIVTDTEGKYSLTYLHTATQTPVRMPVINGPNRDVPSLQLNS
jgi:hypothetical protein